MKLYIEMLKIEKVLDEAKNSNFQTSVFVLSSSIFCF